MKCLGSVLLRKDSTSDAETTGGMLGCTTRDRDWKQFLDSGKVMLQRFLGRTAPDFAQWEMIQRESVFGLAGLLSLGFWVLLSLGVVTSSVQDSNDSTTHSPGPEHWLALP